MLAIVRPLNSQPRYYKTRGMLTADISANQSSSKSRLENFNLEYARSPTIGKVIHIKMIAIRPIWALLDSVGTAAQSCKLIALASANV